MSQKEGLAFATIGAVAYGVQYIPVKKYEIYDGITFQWFMCSGILFSGALVSILVCQTLDVIVPCVYGGFLWAMANYLVIPLVQLLGMGLGFALYHFINLVVGYSIGRFGLFDMPRMRPTDETFYCDIGCLVLLIGFVIMIFIDAEDEEARVDVDEGASRRSVEMAQADGAPTNESQDAVRNMGDEADAARTDNSCEVNSASTKGRVGSNMAKWRNVARSIFKRPNPIDKEVCRSSVILPPATSLLQFGVMGAVQRGSRQSTEFSSPDNSWNLKASTPLQSPSKSQSLPTLQESFDADTSQEPPRPRMSGMNRKMLGGVLALAAGFFTGTNSVPSALYLRQNLDMSAFSTVFSQTLGIWLASTTIYILYATAARMAKWAVPHSVIRPAFISGCIWTVGFSCCMAGIKNLGYAVGYTLDAVGPVAISSVLAVFYFKEITGTQRLTLFGASLFCQVVGVCLIAAFGEE